MDKHENKTIKPPPAIPLVLVRAKAAYQLWHKYLVNLKRIDRYTVGLKIDENFSSLLEFIFRACFAFDKFEKLSLLSQAIGKSDLLKFSLQIGWEQEIIDQKNYGILIIELNEIGRQLGAWKKSVQEKTLPPK